MYIASELAARSQSPLVPVTMPLHVLLALPDYVTRDPAAPIFNLPATIADLLGQFGWERATKIVQPRIWAPGWTDDDIMRFATSSFSSHPELFKGVPLRTLRLAAFPRAASTTKRPEQTPASHNIIHFIGHVEWNNGDRTLRISDKLNEWAHAPGLGKDLFAVGTRLLILQVPLRDFGDAVELGKTLLDEGVHAVVILGAADPSILAPYLRDLYANIIHNEDLPDVCKPVPWMREADTLEQTADLNVHLLYRQGFAGTLRFDAWLSSLQGRLEQLGLEVGGKVAEGSARSAAVRSKLETSRMLHASQRNRLGEKLQEVAARLNTIGLTTAQMRTQLKSSLDFAHEHGGVEPLSRIAELVPALEAEAKQADLLYPELEKDVAEAERNAPRVLNANFADVEQGRILEPREGLVAGKEYDLLVDVGPSWDRVSSIVSGAKAFPETALPAGVDGHWLKVVFASADLLPKLVADRIWLPADHGRSHRVVEGKPTTEGGPVRLRVGVPRFSSDESPTIRTAHGRLFVYYENNLLQAASVTVGIVREAGATLRRANSVDVDYALTATFAALHDTFAQRAVRLAESDLNASHPIGLNITLNQDGRGTHRILVQGNTDLRPAWMTYDPTAAVGALEQGRDALIKCYWLRDSNGDALSDKDGHPVAAFNADNGKNLEQFQFDLFTLAKVGRSLYNQAFLGLQADEVKDWESELRKRLATSTVIQVARLESTPANYVFPWGLLYDHPLSGTSDQYKVCPVVWQWSDEGVRTKPFGIACPFADTPEHKEDILCPYGFWGLKHLIEQPLAPAVGNSALRGAAKNILFGPTLKLSVGWTRDQSLDLNGIDAHLQRIEGLRSIRLTDTQPNPADDRNSVRALLSVPNLVYFLCHCERVPTEREPYLHVGPRDDLESHRIYVNTIRDWTQSTLANWHSLTPLVFINGCHTSDLKPGEVLNFVSAFARAGAAAVIGTEVSVQLPVAMEIAEMLLRKLVTGSSIGEATREMRWELANKGNLLGLCYTAYGLADLRLIGN